MVDLVHHQMAAASPEGLRQGRQLVGVQHGTGGVGRRCDQGPHAVGIPVSLDQLRGQLITRLRAYRHQLRAAFHQAQEMAIAGVAGVGQQPVPARVHQQAAGQKQRPGAAGGDENAFRVYVQPIARRVEAGDGFAQLRQAAGGGVSGMPGGQGCLPGLDDGLGSAEVRFADLKVDHVVTRRLEFVGTGQQGHDVEGFDGAAARTVGLSHWPSFIKAKRGFYPMVPGRCSMLGIGEWRTRI
ncbi:hypothetical protein D3C78_537030 [compost metagenome]